MLTVLAVDDVHGLLSHSSLAIAQNFASLRIPYFIFVPKRAVNALINAMMIRLQHLCTMQTMDVIVNGYQRNPSSGKLHAETAKIFAKRARRLARIVVKSFPY